MKPPLAAALALALLATPPPDEGTPSGCLCSGLPAPAARSPPASGRRRRSKGRFSRDSHEQRGQRTHHNEPTITHGDSKPS